MQFKSILRRAKSKALIVRATCQCQGSGKFEKLLLRPLPDLEPLVLQLGSRSSRSHRPTAFQLSYVQFSFSTADALGAARGAATRSCCRDCCGCVESCTVDRTAAAFCAKKNPPQVEKRQNAL